MRKCIVDRKIVELLVQKKSFNKISKQLKVGKTRIRKVYDLADKKGYLKGTPLPPYPQAVFDYRDDPCLGPASDVDEALSEYLDWIKERKEVGWHWVTIWEELPIEVNRSSFYRFVKRHKIGEDIEKSRCRVRVVPEIFHEPGESLILDWGKLCDVIDPDSGKKKTLWFLTGVMGFSRYMMTRLVWGNGVEETLDAIQSMFNEMGGVPQKLTSDNPKCFATQASKFEAILNPAFERFCSHYGVVAELLPPRDPEKKGKVERLVPYIRRLYEAHGDFVSLAASQRYIDRKMALANERRHGTTKLRPIDVFLKDEAPILRGLPNVAYLVEEYHTGKVRKDGHVRFRNKYYSMGEEYVGQEVFIIGGRDTVEIFFKGNLIETHRRVKSAHLAKSTKKHHLKPHEQVMQDNDKLLEKAKKIGLETEEMIKSILMRGRGYVDTRSIWGILSLDKDYGKEQINKACRYALECDQLGYQAVMRFINVMPKEEKLIEKSVGNKFTRDPSEYGVQLDFLN
jgi:transposase